MRQSRIAANGVETQSIVSSRPCPPELRVLLENDGRDPLTGQGGSRGESGRAPADDDDGGFVVYFFRAFFGTNARKRRGLSTMIARSVSSLAPAALSFGTKTVSVLA